MGGTPLYVLDRQKKIQNASISSWQRWRPLQTWMYFWVLAQSHAYLHLQLVVYEAKPNKAASQQQKTEERDTGGDLAILPRNETFCHEITKHERHNWIIHAKQHSSQKRHYILTVLIAVFNFVSYINRDYLQ